MRKLKLTLFLLTFVSATGLFYSCDDELNGDNGMTPSLDESDLIEAIISSTNKQMIDTETLPASALTAIDENYSEDFISAAQFAPELGYEVDVQRTQGAWLGERSQLYFDTNGRELRTEGGELEPGERPERKRRYRRPRVRDCFEFVFPLSITMPDGSTITLESGSDWSDVRVWHQENPEVEGRPAFDYPIEVVFDGENQVINNQDEMHRLKFACREANRKPRCFEMVFPLSLTMPDGSTITLESREDRAEVKAWHEANPDVRERGTLVFPVDILYTSGETLTINSAEELQQAKVDCRNSQE
ncbi:MAG: hypothetical protein AAF992_13895 [Bacteroidota bacterium]